MTNTTQADLQAALNGGGTVTFGVGGVITLTNTIIITQDTVLDAAGFAVTISGGNAVRLFQVNSNVAFSVNGLTLADGQYIGANGASAVAPGQDGSGAGILNLGGTVALAGCALTNHFAKGGDGGPGVGTSGGNGCGAAVCSEGGTVNLTNCLVAGNSTRGGAGVGGETGYPPAVNGQGLGGAIYSADGQVNLQGVTFQTNSTTGLGGAIYSADGQLNLQGATVSANTVTAGMGGAIYATHSEVLIRNSAVSSNSVIGSVATGLGGALFLSADSTALIELSSFAGNKANGGRFPNGIFPPHIGAAGLGGAVYSGGRLQIVDSTFSGNGCYGAFGAPAGGAQGGAVSSTNFLVLNGCTFDHNTAAAGGGTSEAAGSSLPGVEGEGGAIWSSGSLAATNSTWATNSALGGDAYNDFSNLAGGAGSGGALCVTGGSATLVSATVAGNQAVGGGQEQGSQVPTGPSQGGGLYSTKSAVTVANSIIANSLSGGDVIGFINDAGYNLYGAAPWLGPLSENGGPTETMALLTGSPALDAIPSGFPPVDQRGVSRPQGPLADIGAFESLAGTAGGPLGITLLPGNSLAIQFLGVPGMTYNLQASTDLIHWTGIGVATPVTNSEFQFIDTGTNVSSARFYRTRVP